MSTPVLALRVMPGKGSEHHDRLENLRHELREELEARLRELRVSSSLPEAVEVNDFEELCEKCSTTEIGATIVEITSRTLQGIEGALERLQRGKYGVCSECKTEIGVTRLRAMPFAERCRDCQELADARSLALAG